MPNWCSNSLTISGDVDNIEKIRLDLSQPVFSISNGTGWLSKVDIETPPWGMYWTEEEKLEKSVLDPYMQVCSRTLMGLGLDYSSIGYNEMIEWVVGCKWDFNLDVVKEAEDQLVYSFSSPWGPPLIWVARVALKYKLQVDIEFEEGGSDFAGKLKADGVGGSGILIESNYSQYRLAEIGDIEYWIQEDVVEYCEDEAGIQEWREKAKDWPLTTAKYDVKYLTGEFDLKDHFIPSK